MSVPAAPSSWARFCEVVACRTATGQFGGGRGSKVWWVGRRATSAATGQSSSFTVAIGLLAELLVAGTVTAVTGRGSAAAYRAAPDGGPRSCGIAGVGPWRGG